MSFKVFLAGLFVVSLISFLTIFQASGQSENIRFRHLNNANGLSHNKVNSIHQDRFGFVWLGTEDGLDRFDGYTFTKFKYHHRDSSSLAGDIVYSICEDSLGNLWVGTSSGLCMYNRDKNNFTRIQSKSLNHSVINSSPIWDLEVDGDNNLWIAVVDSGIFQFNLESLNLTRYVHDSDISTSLSDNYVRELFLDSNGNLWLGSTKGLDRFDKHQKVFQHYLNKPEIKTKLAVSDVRSITQGSDNNLYVGVYGGGLVQLQIDSLNNNSVRYIQHRPGRTDGLPNNYVQKVLADGKGGLWVGIENYGLTYVRQDLESFMHYRADIANSQGLNNNSFYSMFLDNVGDIWIGTYKGGVNILHHSKQAFKHYKNKKGEINSLANNNVTRFYESKDGSIWIGTDGGGLNKFDEASGTFITYSTQNTNLNANEVLTICEDSDGNIWIGTWGGGISSFDRKQNRFTSYTTENTHMRSNNVMKLISDRNNRIIFITHGGGIGYFDTKSRQVNDFIDELPKNLELTDLIEDGYGNLIFGSYNGLYIYNVTDSLLQFYQHNPEHRNSLSNNYIFSLLESNDSILWIGTANGLNRLNRITNEFRSYFIEDGLPSNSVNCILSDHEGNIWVSTNNGIARFDVRSEVFTNYSVADGLQGNEFSRFSALRSNTGRLYFGGTNGFNAFYPGDIKINKTIPPIVITDFKLFNKSVNPADVNSPLDRNICETKEIRLNYKQSSFSFSFVAMNYISSNKNRYKYRLEGFDKEWIEDAGYRTAIYTNVNPGYYIFTVIGSNDDGIWNDTGKSIQIYISPPWWQTWWFIAVMVGIGVFILIIVAIYVKALRREIRSRKRAEQQILENLDRIKSINKKLENYSFTISHDLKEPIRSIRTFSEFIQEDYGDQFDEEASDYFNRIIRASTKMALMIDDLLVLSRVGRTDTEFKKVSISEIIDEVIEVLQQRIHETNTELIVGEMPEIVCQPVWINALFSNLLTNSIKYKGNSPPVIEVRYRNSSGYHEFSVKDNGRGIAVDQQEKVFGLFRKAHQDRNAEGSGAGLAIVSDVIEQHKGKIWISWSELDKGTEITFTIKKEE